MADETRANPKELEASMVYPPQGRNAQLLLIGYLESGTWNAESRRAQAHRDDQRRNLPVLVEAAQSGAVHQVGGC